MTDNITLPRQTAQQALEALLSVKNHGWDEDTHTGRALITALRTALEQQQVGPVQELEYAWPTIADYERDVGFKTNEAFCMAWNMARTTNKMLGHSSSPQQQAEPNRWVIEKVGDKLMLNGNEVDPGTIELRLDGLTYRSSEKMEVRQQAEPVQENITHITWDERGVRTVNGIPDDAPQQAEPVSHAVIAGVLFDFMGWLTTREERLVLSSTDNATPAADAVTDFAEMRGLSLNDAKVQDWQDYTAPPQRKPLTDEEIYECERIAAIRHQKHKYSIRGQQFTAADDPQWHFARAIEAAHGIKEGT